MINIDEEFYLKYDFIEIPIYEAKDIIEKYDVNYKFNGIPGNEIRKYAKELLERNRNI